MYRMVLRWTQLIMNVILGVGGGNSKKRKVMETSYFPNDAVICKCVMISSTIMPRIDREQGPTGVNLFPNTC